jgi:hypothetical protein
MSNIRGWDMMGLSSSSKKYAGSLNETTTSHLIMNKSNDAWLYAVGSVCPMFIPKNIAQQITLSSIQYRVNPIKCSYPNKQIFH